MTLEELELAKLGAMMAGASKQISGDYTDGRHGPKPVDVHEIIRREQLAPSRSIPPQQIPVAVEQTFSPPPIVMVDGIPVEAPSTLNLIPMPGGSTAPVIPTGVPFAAPAEAKQRAPETPPVPSPWEVLTKLVAVEEQVVEQLKVIGGYLKIMTTPTDLSSFGIHPEEEKPDAGPGKAD